ncbi:MAG: hypothetical protein V3U14_13035 [candidate division NC10 bacterium]
MTATTFYAVPAYDLKEGDVIHAQGKFTPLRGTNRSFAVAHITLHEHTLELLTDRGIRITTGLHDLTFVERSGS